MSLSSCPKFLSGGRRSGCGARMGLGVCMAEHSPRAMPCTSTRALGAVLSQVWGFHSHALPVDVFFPAPSLPAPENPPFLAQSGFLQALRSGSSSWLGAPRVSCRAGGQAASFPREISRRKKKSERPSQPRGRRAPLLRFAVLWDAKISFGLHAIP